MSHALDSTPTFTDPVLAPDNGAAATAEDFDQPTTALTQRTAYLKGQVDALNHLRPAYSIVGAGFATPLLSVFTQAVNQTSWLTTSISVSVNSNLGHTVQNNDILEFILGPFSAECDAADTLGLQCIVTQGSITQAYPMQIIGSGITSQPVIFPVSFISSGTGDIVVGLQASNKGGAHTSYVQSSQEPTNTYGWGSDITTPQYVWQYFSYKLLRVVI